MWIRTRRSATVLGLCWLLLNGNAVNAQSTAPSETKSETKESTQWTEKQRVGNDVPLEAWRDLSVTPWAAILCLHGLSLHAKNYADLGTRLAHLGLPTYAIDIRGFGSWQKTDLGYDLDFETTFQDIENALVAIHKAHPGLPVILLGESMGGGLALQATVRYPSLVDGLICSVPSIKRYSQNSTKMKVGFGLLTSSKKEISVGKKVAHRSTTDPQVIMDWEADPLARMSLSPKDLVRYEKLMQSNSKDAERITKTSVLFLQGGSDRLIKPAGTLALFNRLKTPDKNMIMVGSAEHLIFEQGQFTDDVVELVSDWIDKHVSTPRLEQTANTSIKTGRTNGLQLDADRVKEALAHFKIAEGFIMLGDNTKASEHLLKTTQIAKGSALAARAHRILLTLPDNVIAPTVGGKTAGTFRLVDLNAAKKNDQPSILIFKADWIDSCKGIVDDVKTALGANRDKFNVVVIDADDPKNNDILTEYGVKPLPTILYLSGKNEVTFYTLGNPGITAISTRIKQILADETRSHEAI
jgi:alpha-beta hydrolase superfamily lysophospholipase/thiol-disulfide isomerase/thioredoxin